MTDIFMDTVLGKIPAQTDKATYNRMLEEEIKKIRKEYKQLKAEYEDVFHRLCLVCQSVTGSDGQWFLNDGTQEWWSKNQSKWLAWRNWKYLNRNVQESIKKHIDELIVNED